MPNAESSHSFKLADSDLGDLKKIEDSITNFSVQLSRAFLQIDEMKSGLVSLYNARQQLLNQTVKKVGLDPHKIMSMKLDGSGNVTVVMSDSPNPGPIPVPNSM